jgi:hypothetical protein
VEGHCRAQDAENDVGFPEFKSALYLRYMELGGMFGFSTIGCS